MRIPRNKHGQNDDKRSKNRETGMSQNMSQSMRKNRGSRGRNLLAGASAAAVAAGLSANAQAGDADRHRLEIGLGISRLNIDAPTETFEPFWAGDWDDTNFELPLSAPNQDLEADLGRELWLRFRPKNSAWSFDFGVRDGGSDRSIDVHQTAGVPEILKYPEGTGYFGGVYNTPQSPQEPEFVSVLAERHEEFSIVEFEVGRDVGLGFLGAGGESRAGFGLRYARFQSDTTGVTLRGMPNRYDPAYQKYGCGCHYADTFDASFESRREFEGWGPSASWTAAKPLFGSERAGHVLLDWSLGGGVLFGKQETEGEWDAASRYYVWTAGGGLPVGAPGQNLGGGPVDEELDSASHDREDHLATVPFVDLDLGLSYKRKRTRVSLGYSFEEYFGAIDGGVDERRVYDRTFEGPYLRFSVGFGDGGE